METRSWYWIVGTEFIVACALAALLMPIPASGHAESGGLLRSAAVLRLVAPFAFSDQIHVRAEVDGNVR